MTLSVVTGQRPTLEIVSETDKPQSPQPEQPDPGPQAESQQEQTVQTPPAAPPPPPPPPPAIERRPPHTVRTWVAAAIGGAILVGAGLGGYFIGAANDHDRDRPDHDRDRPGISRFGDHRPFPPGDGPGFHGERPNRGGATPG